MKPNYCYCCDKKASAKLVSEIDDSFFYCCGDTACKKKIKKTLRKLNKQYIKSNASVSNLWKSGESRYNYKTWREENRSFLFLVLVTVIGLLSIMLITFCVNSFMLN